MRTRQKQVIAVVVVSGLVAGWFLLLNSGGGAQAAQPSVAAPVRDVPGAARTYAAPGHATQGAAFDPDVFLSAAALTKDLETYKRMAVYPIWSRPHDEGSAYLLRWNQVAGSQAIFDNTPGKESFYLFEADKNHVDFGEAITSWVRVYGVDQKPVPFEIADAYVAIMSGPRQGRHLKLDYHDDGQDGDLVAGDGVLTNRFVPAQHEALAMPEQAKLVAEIVIDGKMMLAERQFGFAPRAVLDVVGMSEHLEQGSLAVTVDVEVHEAGGYNFQANLVAAAGDVPVAWLDIHAALEPGRQQVTLVFFGKAIRDVGVAGPFVVRDLRGYVSLFDPDTTLWWSDNHTLTTRAYAMTEFSPEEYDDDEKRGRIDNFEHLIAAAQIEERGGGGEPARLVERDSDGTEHEVPYPDPTSPP